MVVCDETADPEVVASDMLAQAEHDVVARPILVTFSKYGKATALKHIHAVNEALDRQLEVLPTKAVAEPAVKRGFAVACKDVEEAIRVSDAVAPEHLEVICRDERTISKRMNHYGGLFIGRCAAEVLGDYGIGPGHVTDLGPGALHGRFMCQRPAHPRGCVWIKKKSQVAVEDAVRLAHEAWGPARAAGYRLRGGTARGKKAKKRRGGDGPRRGRARHR